MRTERDLVLALAGIFQAASLTQQIARSGQASDAGRRTLLYSLMQIDADDVPAVFGGIDGLRVGLECLQSQLTPGPQRDTEVTRYAVGLMQIERRLNRDADRLASLGEDITELVQRQRDFDLDDGTVQSQLEDIYRRHISTSNPQIMVKGEPVYLQNPNNGAMIRSLLLAGIRCARLWRQCGGSRTQLIFRRQRLLNATERVLAHIGESPD